MKRRKHTLSRLPSLPTIAVQVLEVFGNPNTSIQKVAELVLADPAMASKILKAANSSRFGLRREVGDVRQAISLMGKVKVTPIVLSFSLASESIEDPQHAIYFQRYWLHSFAQATAAEVVGASVDQKFASECFTVNLLAGIGKLALLKNGVEQYLECAEAAATGEDTLENIERAVFGISNKELTLEMLESSGLPMRCIEAIASTVPGSELYPTSEEAEQLGQVVRVADAFSRFLCEADSGVGMFRVQERIAEMSTCNVDIETLSTQVRHKLDESASLFDLDTNILPDPEDLLQDALDQLSEFTERMQDKPNEVPTELVAENGRLKQQVEDLVRQTSTDSLTNVANRAFFDRRMVEMTKQALRRQAEMGVAIIDIDHFKKVNDTYGHLAGDQVLKVVAESLALATRSNETLARYGGEEFTILLEDIKPGGMVILGERLRTTVENLQVCFEGSRIPITVSIGIATGRPTSDCFGSKLFAEADEALYRAKEGGRNRIGISSGSPNQHGAVADFRESDSAVEPVCRQAVRVS